MGKNLASSMFAVMAGGLILTAPASASPMFTLSGPTGTTTVGGASIDFTTLVYGTNTISGTFLETYAWSSGSGGTATLKIVSQTAVNGFTMGETLITISETGADLLPNTSPSSVNLYSGVTSLSLASNFATDLGTVTNPSTGSVSGANFSVTDQFVAGTVSSAASTLTLPNATPEPSTMSMLAMAMFVGLGYSARRKLNFRSSAK